MNGNSVPGKAFQPDFESFEHTDVMYRMFFNDQNVGNIIELRNFKDGYVLFCFDLDGESSKDIMVDQKFGQCRLEVSFGTALPETVTLIAYALFPSLLKIDKARNVTLV